VVAEFNAKRAGAEDTKAAQKIAKSDGRVDRGVEAIVEVTRQDASFWRAIRQLAQQRNLLFPEDEKALFPTVNLPRLVPTDSQAVRLIRLLSRCEELGFTP
jgi:hypothetical protein